MQAIKLNQTNIGSGQNNNKFYIIQVLQSSSGQYFTWNRFTIFPSFCFNSFGADGDGSVQKDKVPWRHVALMSLQ